MRILSPKKKNPSPEKNVLSIVTQKLKEHKTFVDKTLDKQRIPNDLEKLRSVLQKAGEKGESLRQISAFVNQLTYLSDDEKEQTLNVPFTLRDQNTNEELYKNVTLLWLVIYTDQIHKAASLLKNKADPNHSVKMNYKLYQDCSIFFWFINIGYHDSHGNTDHHYHDFKEGCDLFLQHGSDLANGVHLEGGVHALEWFFKPTNDPNHHLKNLHAPIFLNSLIKHYEKIQTTNPEEFNKFFSLVQDILRDRSKYSYIPDSCLLPLKNFVDKTHDKQRIPQITKDLDTHTNLVSNVAGIIAGYCKEETTDGAVEYLSSNLNAFAKSDYRMHQFWKTRKGGSPSVTATAQELKDDMKSVEQFIDGEADADRKKNAQKNWKTFKDVHSEYIGYVAKM